MKKNKLKLNYFLDGFEKIEKEKIEFFFLTYRQKTLTINAPSDNAKQKEFLGYDWSNRKGSEGIQIIKAGGKLYDDKDRFAKNTLASLIRQMFINNTCQIGDEYQEYAYMVKTCDMLDFGLASFNYALRTNIQKKVEIESKYPLVRLGEVCNICGGNTFQEIYQGNTNNLDIPFFKVSDMNHKQNKIIMTIANNYVDDKTLKEKIKAFIFDKDTLVFPKVGMAIHTNKKRLLGQKSAIDNNTMGFWVKDSEQLLYLYLYHYFDVCIDLKSIASNANPPSISATNLSEVKIPLPPLEIQEKIIRECQEIDKEYETSRMTIETYRQKIADIFNELEVVESSIPTLSKVKLGDVCHILIGGTPSREIYEYFKGDNLWVSIGEMNGNIILDTKEKITDLAVKNSNVKLIPKGTTLLSFKLSIGKVALAGVDLYTNEAIAGLIPKDNSRVENLYLFHMFKAVGIDLNNIGNKAFGKSLNISFLKNNLIITLPTLYEQQNIITQVEQYEQQIQQAEKIIEQTAERKKLVLSKYL